MARVCMVAYTHYRTDSRVRREAEALVDQNNLVDFICLEDEVKENPEYYDGVRLIKIPVPRYRGSNALFYIFSYLQFFILASCRLMRLQLKNSYQIIQVHTMPDFMVFVGILPKIMGAKIILDVHDLMPELFQSKFGYTEKHLLIRFITWIERLSVGFADRAIAVHQPHLDALCAHGNDPEKFSVLLNLPDGKVFSNGRSNPANNTDFELVYHGTISQRHGLEVAIRAVASLNGRLNGLKLKVYGDGDDVPRLLSLVKELDLQESVDFSNGMIPLSDLVSQIRHASVGIVPIYYDGFTKYMLPVKLLEYIRLHIPVICSRTETIEAYFDETMVMYCRPGDVSDLSEKIEYLYRNPGRCEELVVNADRFNQEFSWERQKHTYCELINQLAKK
jgi:glycosyltransferase involved in cell wall biosynthesis